MGTKYRMGYELEKRIVDRLNKTGEWLCQRGPSSKGIDVLACSKKHLKTVFMECKNTDAKVFRVDRGQLLGLIKKGWVGGAEVFLVIHWRGIVNEKDKRRKRLSFFPREVLVQKLETQNTKTVLFKPFEYQKTFDDVFV